MRLPPQPTPALTACDMGALTEAERGLLDLLCAGYTVREAAKLRGIAPGTAKYYMLRAKRATGALTRISLAAQYALWSEGK